MTSPRTLLPYIAGASVGLGLAGVMIPTLIVILPVAAGSLGLHSVSVMPGEFLINHGIHINDDSLSLFSNLFVDGIGFVLTGTVLALVGRQTDQKKSN
jgi:hypothetical protein